MKVVVVGAGTAGLAALHTLISGGADAVALEAEDHAGGRIAGARRRGFALDRGAQFVMEGSAAAGELCGSVGLGDDLVPYLFKAANWRNGRFYTAVIDKDPGVLWRNRRYLLNSQGFTLRGAVQLFGFMPAFLRRRRDLDLLHPELVLDLDGESAEAFTSKHGGDEVLEGMMRPVVNNLTMGEPEDVSAGYALTMLWKVLSGLCTLKRGFGALASRLHDLHGERIHLSTPVRRIVLDGRAVRGVETDDGFMEADEVICATPASAALALLPGLPDSVGKPLGMARYSACCHVILALPDRIFPDGWYAVGLPRGRGLSLNLTDNSRKSPYYAPEGCGLIHCFSYGRDSHELLGLDDEEVLRRVTGEIQRYFPSMPDEPLFSEVHRWREAVCLTPPGMLRAVQAAKEGGLREPSGLCLAGEYMYMPSVEGALQSGMDAAREVLSRG